MLRLLIGFLLGFCFAVFLIAELGGPGALVIFLAGMVGRFVLAELIIKPTFRSHIDDIRAWAESHPLKAQFYIHAREWAMGRHKDFDVLDCADCKAVTSSAV